MKTDARAAALVALVEADLAERTRAVVEPARAQAREELRAARHAARLRVATAIAEERAACAAKVGAAEARLATARRMARQRQLKALLAEGWTHVAAALAARWRDTEGRGAWVRAALGHARAILPAGAWRIAGPPQWSEDEREAATAALATHGIQATAAADATIEAGLRIVSGKVEVDATLAGLLADRAAVEGRLLHWHEQEAAP